ncbi:hypothetical protein MO867_07105 [Microbulbifer sp. OS29]|uniref:UDP-N-acetylmuramyl pentapeptide phosphotransferase/UDP-N-acetylglucosamine-1-phosphate transferase n=1 Tax=Microbulbifer okhotskensis TaxID=2926617 RepID=A0A9X2J585_9GAMM|nr:hypothetical protein [Microbulbifer okhotskensis]MCO1334109.1 hypothetical protein [Microbulbifer okhotskensis]
MLIGCSAAVLVSPLALSPLLVAAFALLLLVSAVDDLRHVAMHFRFSTHLVAVALLLLALPAALDWWYYPVLVLAGAWVVNLYNFMDGMDGLAGSMALVGFSSLGAVCALSGDAELAWLCVLIAVCAAIFLMFNWPTAKIFLGDAGSTCIGLAAVAIGLFGWQRDAFELWVPVVLFAPFWLDATYTLIRRVLVGERWWEAHREHLYQKSALRIGVRKTLFFQLSGMLTLAAVVLAVTVLRAA